MGKTVVVMSCAHTQPGVSNERFTWLGKMLYDLRPDEFINLGDFSEMESLSSFDTRYPGSVVRRSYEADVNVTNDAHERMWHEFRKNKRGLPYRIFLEGNHERRIGTAISKDPGLEGSNYGISMSHLSIDSHYNEFHPYEHSAPAIVYRDGVLYSHFLSSGAYGRSIDGVNHGLKMVEKTGSSVTVGHSHKFNYFIKAETYPKPAHGLSVGCFLGSPQGWAGQANDEWSRGVVIKRNLEDGNYDLQWVSLNSLEREYS
jgi:hypothetical protein